MILQIGNDLIAMVQPDPYNAKLPILAVDNTHGCDYGATANKQLTIKIEKCPLWDRVEIPEKLFFYLQGYLLAVAHTRNPLDRRS